MMVVNVKITYVFSPLSMAAATKSSPSLQRPSLQAQPSGGHSLLPPEPVSPQPHDNWTPVDPFPILKLRP